jgi:hypothetical protein
LGVHLRRGWNADCMGGREVGIRIRSP